MLESPGRLVKTDAWAHLQSVIIDLSNRVPRDAELASSNTTVSGP